MYPIPQLPAPIREVLYRIAGAGGQGYVVGGSLRDILLGNYPKDWDIAATLPKPVLLTLFMGAKDIGGNCGTISVPFGKGVCQITPCREETAYTDHRHPDKVRFSPNIFADLARRDFTINAMATDGEILLDPFGGQLDLSKRLLRCVGNPATRFKEDPLRILRLFRFAATLDFTAEWNTFLCACDLADSIDWLSRERVREEMEKILLSPGPQVLGSLITKGGLYKYGFVFAPSLAPLAEVPLVLLCRWWALMALCGADVDVVGKAFGFSNRFQEELRECTALYRMGPVKDKIALKQKIRNTRLDYAPLAVTFAAVSPSFIGEPVLFAGIKSKKEPYRLKDLAIDGDMLRYEGIKGKHCGQILDELLTAVIKNPSLNKTEILIGLARGLRQLL